jgi:cell division protein FtsB
VRRATHEHADCDGYADQLAYREQLAHTEQYADQHADCDELAYREQYAAAHANKLADGDSDRDSYHGAH